MNQNVASARDLALNLHWTWHAPTAALLATLPGFTPGRHPALLLTEIAVADPDSAIERWAEEHAQEIATLAAELDSATDNDPSPRVAYFSPEFGIAAQVPQYSGGLGILAGDHLKAASDRSVPLVGIGLLYREGFFQQEIVAGSQHERYDRVTPADLGAVDTGHIVEVEIEARTVACRVWHQGVGSTRLYLLDTDVETNTAADQKITDRLYSGDRRHRLHQELVLGVGGVRALRALGIAPQVYHLNEGHACFLLLELLAEAVEAGASLDAAVDAVRAQTLFTTHTPVPAGIDRFDTTLIDPELTPWAKRLGTTVATLRGWATLPSDGPKKPFNTAAIAFHLCGKANGVSQLHATVSRELFAALPRATSTEGITNGVHARTWVTAPLQTLYDDVLGSNWADGDPKAWSAASSLTDADLESVRSIGKAALVDMIEARTGTRLDPERCIFGFARRFATYKRAALMLRDPEGLEAAIAGGAQFVFSGKAHPADTDGKAVLESITSFAGSKAAAGQFVLVPDYDIGVAQLMYAGSDVWLNNPIRPHEACGTSGEKAALNGGLNCSILDGWWADWFVPGIGWDIPTSDLTDLSARDDAEAVALLELINEAVLPRFEDRSQWWSMVRAMLVHLGPLVTAGRMVDEYDRRFYRPIAEGRVSS